MPALSPVNTLEHMAEHTTFANFLCENTQNTWNTYFCERLEKGCNTERPRGASPGDYIREHMFYVFHVFMPAHR